MSFRLLIFAFLLCILAPGVRAQNIDSLKKQLEKTINADDKAHILNQLANTYLSKDALIALQFARQALDIAGKINNPTEKASALQVIALYFSYKSEYHKAASYFLKAARLTDPMLDPQTTGEIYKNLSTTYYQSGNSDSAKYFARKSINILKNSSYTNVLIQSYQFLGNIFLENKEIDSAIYYFELTLKGFDVLVKNQEGSPESYKKSLTRVAALQGQLGTVYYMSGDFSQAVSNIQKAIAVCIVIGDKDLLPSLYSDLGNVYKMQQSSDKAVEYYYKALKIYELKNNQLQVANTYNKIGGIYFDQGNYDNAYRYYQLAHKLHTKSGNKPGIAATVNNLGEVFKMRGMNDSASHYYTEALKINSTLGNKVWMGINYQNIGEMYLMANDFKKALYYFNQAINMFNETKYREVLSSINISMGTYYLKSRNFSKALEHFKKAWEVSNELKDQQQLTNSAKGLADSYEKLGNTREALFYYKVYSMQKDSLLTLEKHRKLTEIQTKFEFEKQKGENELQQEAINSLEKSKSFNQILRYLLSTGFILLLVIGYLLLKRKNIVIQNERLKMDKENAVIQTRHALTEADLKNRMLEKSKLEEELKYKTNNLMNLAMHISQKNEFLAEVKQGLKETRHLQVNEKENKISDLIIKITHQTKLNKDLDHFQREIEKANKDFFNQLKNVCPSLTENEKQLAALLRINLSSKEIASLNNISVKAIEMSRYRLRKKLDIESNESLTAYLQKLV